MGPLEGPSQGSLTPCSAQAGLVSTWHGRPWPGWRSARPGAYHRPMTKRLTWGPWALQTSNLTLVCQDYEVDLERVTSGAEALDWIAQVAGKTWSTPDTIGYLVLALDDLLELQENLCGGGLNRTLDKARIAALVRQAAEGA